MLQNKDLLTDGDVYAHRELVFPHQSVCEETTLQRRGNTNIKSNTCLLVALALVFSVATIGYYC